MRTAILVQWPADGSQPEMSYLGPVEAKAKAKELAANPAVEFELWISDAGCVRWKKPKAEKIEVAATAPVETQSESAPVETPVETKSKKPKK
jgi:hypothetical protein